jgi:SAM-dependent methyltransferase
MKYRLFKQIKKNETSGGDYWEDADFSDHLNLTCYQTTYLHLLKKYSTEKSILEAGCGIGRWVIPLSKTGYNVTGIEIESKALEVLEQNYQSPNLKLVVGDIFKMPFKNEEFDIVISLGVLEHFEEKQVQNAAIEEHKRVMRKDGIFLVTVPHLSLLRFLVHAPFVKLVSFVRFLKGKKEFFTEYRYSKREFRAILESNGLEIIETVYDDLLPPFNFGLTVDYPLNVFFKNKDKVQYKLNNFGVSVSKILWKINPQIVSGGIGFVCRKTT